MTVATADTPLRTPTGVLLALLITALALSYIDRYMLAVLIEPIRHELQLSDTAIGLLTGFAFTAIYATAGLPLARFADRGHRRSVIAGSVLMWSVMTALMAAVGNVVQMAIVRFGVGAGEAGVFPTAQAVIADHVPQSRRTAAMAIFAAGGNIGLLVAFAAGGVLEQRFGWRTTFILVALPGLLLAPIAWLLIPARSKPGIPAARRGLFAALWRNRHFRHLPLAQSAVVILLFGQIQWLPAYFERSFHMARTAIGPVLGLIIGVSTISGAILGGLLADRLRVRGDALPLKLAGTSIILALPAVFLLYGTSNPTVALCGVAASGLLLSVPTGPIAAHLQFVVEPWQRASAAAWAVTIAAFIGSGFGPLAIGVASDLLARGGSQGAALGHALITVIPLAAVWGVWHLHKLILLCDRPSDQGAAALG